MVYFGYMPVIVYAVILLSDFSPFGQLVETEVYGCSGYPLPPEISQRWRSIFALVGGEFMSDTISIIFLKYVMKEEQGIALASPLVMETFIHHLLFWLPSFTGSFVAFEFMA